KAWDLQYRYMEQSDVARKNNLKVFFCPSRRKVPGGYSADNYAGYPIVPQPGGMSDYASNAGVTNSDGAMMIGTATGIRPDGTSITDNFSSSPAGTRIVKWRGQINLLNITDGTSNTLLIGEKFIRKASLDGKNEDRSIFNSANANNYARNLGVHPTNGNVWKLVDDPNATLTTWPLCNESFGGPHTGICIFVFADGAVRGV